MKKINYNRVIQVIYPLFVYYIVYNVSAACLYYIFNEGQQSLYYLMWAGIITCFPVIYIYYKSPKLIGEKINKVCIFYDLIYIVISVFIACILNIIITKLGFLDYSIGFKNAQTLFSSGDFAVKILCNVIVIPILEEFLYRGTICGQIAVMKNHNLAIVFSAFCFGILHFNIVQFLYAFLVGIVLGYSYIKTKHLWVVIVSHAVINLIVILNC